MTDNLIRDTEITASQRVKMRRWIFDELERNGCPYRSHDFGDFFAACRMVVSAAAKKFCKNNVSFRFVWNCEATLIVL